MFQSRRAHHRSLLAIGTLSTLLLAGCSNTAAPGTPTGMQVDDSSLGFTSFEPSSVPAEESEVLPNDYDFSFAVMMIPHHQAAVDMSEALLLTDGLDPRIRELGEWISRDQRTEIALMRKWVNAWDSSHPEMDAWYPDDAAMNAVGDGMGDMPHDAVMGGMSDGHAGMSMNPGPATQVFLQQMIPHHEGAIEMCRVTLANGVSAFTRTLCNHIISEQAVEIEAMQKLLAD